MTEAGVVASLEALARNFRWVWDHATQDVFRAVDAALWDDSGDPFRIIRSVTPERLANLAADARFRERVHTAEERLAGYVAGAPARPTIAYFCMEHGMAPHAAHVRRRAGHAGRAASRRRPATSASRWWRSA